MAKVGKCVQCQLLLNWPENINLAQMQCLCGTKLVPPDYGDIVTLQVRWYSKVVPVQGKPLTYTVAMGEPTLRRRAKGRR